MRCDCTRNDYCSNCGDWINYKTGGVVMTEGLFMLGMLLICSSVLVAVFGVIFFICEKTGITYKLGKLFGVDLNG